MLLIPGCPRIFLRKCILVERLSRLIVKWYIHLPVWHLPGPSIQPRMCIMRPWFAYLISNDVPYGKSWLPNRFVVYSTLLSCSNRCWLGPGHFHFWLLLHSPPRSLSSTVFCGRVVLFLCLSSFFIFLKITVAPFVVDFYIKYVLRVTVTWFPSASSRHTLAFPLFKATPLVFVPSTSSMLWFCGDLGINNKTPNRMLTRRLPHTKCINASPRIRLHASTRLKIKKNKNNKK